MDFISIVNCSYSLGELKKTSEDDYNRLTATPDGAGGDMLDRLEEPYGLNIFEKNMSVMGDSITALCAEKSVQTFKITGFKARPYMLKDKEMRIFRTPIPCEWVGGDEERALKLAQKLVGCKIYDNEQDAIDAWAEKEAAEKEVEVENIKSQHENAI
jgi:hypothetical protein